MEEEKELPKEEDRALEEEKLQCTKMKLVGSINQIKQGKDMNLEEEDPTKGVEVEAKIQSTCVTYVTS